MTRNRMDFFGVVCRLLLAAWFAISVFGLFADRTLGGTDNEGFFRQHVASIFESHCVSCHSGSNPKGGLSLTNAKSALAGGDSGAAIVPGSPGESMLLDYVSGDRPQMPKDGVPLTLDEVTSLRHWIKGGARWPSDLTLTDRKPLDLNWWSLLPMKNYPVPARDSNWGRNPIDDFLLAKMRRNGVGPSPEADRRTLIRRLTYDLLGLPPTPEQVAAFLSDQSPDAYEKLVDRLLASPRYGECWGRHWLDVVHFGETHGYDKDKPRDHAWPYRDYVIGAFNGDKPYSRFVEEQVAGDVLWPDDPQALVATGFIVAGPWDYVGHAELRPGSTDSEIALSNDRDDMVMTTMSTFVSMTAHCARCHNHKFDPIRQEDYYRLQADFAGVNRADRPYDPDPTVARSRRTLTSELADLTERQHQLESSLEKVRSPGIDALDRQLRQLKTELAATPADANRASSTLGYHSAISTSEDETKWVQLDLGRSWPIDELVLVPAHVDYGDHPGAGFGFPPRFKVELSESSDFRSSTVVADHTQEDVPNPGDAWVRIPIRGKSARFVRVTATKLCDRTHDWIFALAELAVLSNRTNIARRASVSALDSIEAAPAWGKSNLIDGYSSLERLPLDGNGNLSHADRLREEIERAESQRAEMISAKTDRADAARLHDLAAQIDTVKKRASALPPPQLVYAAAEDFAPIGAFTPTKLPRPVHLLERGSVAMPKQLMGPGALACIRGLDSTFNLPDPNNEGQRRAALARWLTDPKNVLLRRSIVNRVWQYHFGQGIVDSPNDFGRMGSKPSHPELLDWLAIWFMQHGESIKALHRLIVTSAAYRQTSADNPEFSKIDGDNRLLWRMNRRRLDAENVHDALLQCDGKLDLTMGGPSVRQFSFIDDFSPVYDYGRFKIDDPANFRRSVYRFIVRSVPDPFMESLDCADPSILTPKRNTTLTAIQALSMLNDRFVLRHCELLAGRLAKMRPDLSGQIDQLYLLALSRSPTAHESQLMVDYAQHFGLANACRIILNCNEFLFID